MNKGQIGTAEAIHIFENSRIVTKFFVQDAATAAYVHAIAALREMLKREENPGNISDGYHTLNELYHHRAVLFAVICNQHPDKAWKSRLHFDGTMFDGDFIVGIDAPAGPASYHYNLEQYWDMFKVPEIPNAPEWDGYTPAQAIERIASIEPVALVHAQWVDKDIGGGCLNRQCSNCGYNKQSHCYKFCPGCGAIMDGEAIALREKQERHDDLYKPHYLGKFFSTPLTLDELSGMKGKPVYIDSITGESGWRVVENIEEYQAFFSDGDMDFCVDYGKTWLAYRTEPELSKEELV